ncbi:MAG: NAD-dependent epimerase/dehydratase family protein [Bacteroidia bacterium]|nr:NAD-dependent epimerase/dehydratase family protein [Bacteroidia bacterium]
MKGKTALVFGATGLVGRSLLRLLEQDARYAEIVAFSRRETGSASGKIRHAIVPMERPAEWETQVRGDVLYCCLGTTSAKAGSREAFRAVDYGLPVALAEIASRNGIGTFAVVSSMGAHPRSPEFYTRTKGEMERDIALHPIPRQVIVRPSLLLGDRAEQRLGEDIGKTLNRLLDPWLGRVWKGWARYRGIHADTVARAMIELAEAPAAPPRIVESDALHEWGRPRS